MLHSISALEKTWKFALVFFLWQDWWSMDSSALAEVVANNANEKLIDGSEGKIIFEHKDIVEMWQKRNKLYKNKEL